MIGPISQYDYWKLSAPGQYDDPDGWDEEEEWEDDWEDDWQDPEEEEE